MRSARVIVDSRIRILRADIGEELAAELRAQHEHKNPTHEKMVHMGIRFDHRKEPRKIVTWRDDGPWLSLPRGGMSRARDLLAAQDIALRVRDERSDGDSSLLRRPWPSYKRTLFPDQEEALSAILARQTCYLRAPTGCLTGDSLVTINRAGKGGKMRLDHVVHMFNGGGQLTRGGEYNGKRWQVGIPTFVRAPFPDGTVHLARVLGATCSGERDVYLATIGGRRLCLTECHRLMTPLGWRRLDELAIGDDVFVDIASRLELRTLDSVEYAGRRITYDLEVERAEAFIANGLAVHNSGKTTIATAAIARVARPAIVLVWTGALFDQWVERVHEEMGFKLKEIGKVRGGTRRIGAVTIAMQQTVAKIHRDDPFWSLFGVVVADELQRFSAPTFVASIDPFTARYRIGVSADERRKDRREFLAHDEFASMALEIDRRELVALKRVRDVEIRVVPTAWRPEGDYDPESAGDEYKTLLDEMAVSAERDSLVIETVLEERARGEQVLVFALRVEHCRRLVMALTTAGIPAGLMLGGQENVAARTESIAKLKAGTLDVAVGTVQAVGTGVDLPRVGVGIVAAPIAGNRQLFAQVCGRVCRIAGGEGAARLYYLADPGRRKDWPGLLHDGRPVFVRNPEGEWIDARERHNRRAAKDIAFPKEELLPWLSR